MKKIILMVSIAGVLYSCGGNESTQVEEANVEENTTEISEEQLVEISEKTQEVEDSTTMLKEDAQQMENEVDEILSDI